LQQSGMRNMLRTRRHCRGWRSNNQCHDCVARHTFHSNSLRGKLFSDPLKHQNYRAIICHRCLCCANELLCRGRNAWRWRLFSRLQTATLTRSSAWRVISLRSSKILYLVFSRCQTRTICSRSHVGVSAFPCNSTHTWFSGILPSSALPHPPMIAESTTAPFFLPTISLLLPPQSSCWRLSTSSNPKMNQACLLAWPCNIFFMFTPSGRFAPGKKVLLPTFAAAPHRLTQFSCAHPCQTFIPKAGIHCGLLVPSCR